MASQPLTDNDKICAKLESMTLQLREINETLRIVIEIFNANATPWNLKGTPPDAKDE